MSGYVCIHVYLNEWSSNRENVSMYVLLKFNTTDGHVCMYCMYVLVCKMYECEHGSVNTYEDHTYTNIPSVVFESGERVRKPFGRNPGLRKHQMQRHI